MTLHSYAALEDAIAEDPFDEARWIVLEDWLLERNDPRAQLVILEKQGADTRDALDKLAPQLLGPDHAALDERLYVRDWRAGFLRECQYTGGPEHLRSFLAAPASGLLRAFTVTAEHAVVDQCVDALFEQRCVRSLQQLTLSSWNHDGSDVEIMGGGLWGMNQLRHLILRTVMVKEAPVLPRLHALTLAPMRAAVNALSAHLGRVVWPSITDLAYEMPDMLSWFLITPVLDLLSRDTFPRLRRLSVSGIPGEIDTTDLRERCELRQVALTLL